MHFASANYLPTFSVSGKLNSFQQAQSVRITSNNHSQQLTGQITVTGSRTCSNLTRKRPE